MDKKTQIFFLTLTGVGIYALIGSIAIIGRFGLVAFVGAGFMQLVIMVLLAVAPGLIIIFRQSKTSDKMKLFLKSLYWGIIAFILGLVFIIIFGWLGYQGCVQSGIPQNCMPY